MRRQRIKKALKILGGSLLLIVVVLVYLVYSFTSPKSNDEIIESFDEESIQPLIVNHSFKGKPVRVIKMQKEVDSLLPTLFFVHGSPGSAMDFQRYLKDSTLNNLANIMSYDRIGYGPENTGEVLGSLKEEVELLHELVAYQNSSKVILIGYSYGGTVVMASDKKYKKKIVLAASVRGDLEPMFWALNLYKWDISRNLIPKVFKGASIEKLRHVNELPLYEQKWNLSPSKVLSIHGKEDFIVPYQNSLFLQQIFDVNKFSLIPIEDGNHSLIWSNFDVIKEALLKSIKE